MKKKARIKDFVCNIITFLYKEKYIYLLYIGMTYL